MHIRSPGGELFAKYQHGSEPGRDLVAWLRGRPALSAAQREERAAAALGQLGLGTPRFLLSGETRGRFGRPRESFLVSAALEGRALAGMAPEPEIVRALARFVAEISRTRIHIPDLYAKHVFVRRDGDGPVELGLIDLERVELDSRRGSRWLFVRHAAGLVATLPGLTAREVADAADAGDADLLAEVERRAELVRVRKKMPREYAARQRYRDEESVASYRARSPSRHAAELRLLDRLLPARIDGTVLDAPCGAGRFSEILCARGARTLALDLSPAMVQSAARVSPWCGLGELEHLPLADKTVEGALCFRFLHHVPSREQRQRILGELTRVSRRFVVLSFFHPLSPHQALRHLKSAFTGRPIARYTVTVGRLRTELAALGWNVRAVHAQSRFRRDLWALRAEPR